MSFYTLQSGMKFCAIVMASLTAFSWPIVSEAASFDCAKASSPAEKLICSNARLNELDSELARLYHASVKKLSVSESKEILAKQRSWLSTWQKNCMKLDTLENKTRCAMSYYGERIKELKTSTKTVSGLTVYTQIEYDQLGREAKKRIEIIDKDAADNKEQAIAVNKWVRRLIASAEREIYDGSDYSEVKFDNSDLPMTLFCIAHAYGLPRSGGHVIRSGYFLLSEGRPMRSDDIFLSSDWKGAAIERIDAQFKREGRPLLIHFYEDNKMQYISDISNWELDRGNFRIRFDNNMDQTTVAIPWSSIRASLTPQFTKILGIK